MPEFSKIVPIQTATPPPVAPGQNLRDSWMGLPAGSRHLSKPPLRLNGGTGSNIGHENYGETDLDEDQVRYFGVYRTCSQFCHDAVVAGHPISKAVVLPKVLQEAVEFGSSQSMHKLACFRLDTLKYWLGRAKELSPAEGELHGKLHPSLQSILKPKRLLLWKEMMQHYGYPDPGVYEEVVDGIQLAGASPYVPSFDPCFKPARITLCELAQSAPSNREAML